MRRQLITPLALGGMVAVCVAVAAATGNPVWAAALGAGLGLVMWAFEYLGWRRARDASFNGAVAVALGGMVLRLAVVLGVAAAVATAYMARLLSRYRSKRDAGAGDAGRSVAEGGGQA